MSDGECLSLEKTEGVGTIEEIGARSFIIITNIRISLEPERRGEKRDASIISVDAASLQQFT